MPFLIHAESCTRECLVIADCILMLLYFTLRFIIISGEASTTDHRINLILASLMMIFHRDVLMDIYRFYNSFNTNSFLYSYFL